MWIFLLLSCAPDSNKASNREGPPGVTTEPYDQRLPCGGCLEGESCVDDVCVIDYDDDTADLAIPIELGVETFQVIWPDQDQDWYALDVPPLSFVEIQTTSGDDEDFDAMFAWFDVDLQNTPVGEEISEPVSTFVQLPGPTLLRVRDAGDGGDEDFDYSVLVTEFPGPVTSEDFAVGVELGSNEPEVYVAVEFDYPEDVDEVALDVSDGNQFLEIGIYDGNGGPLQAAPRVSVTDSDGVALTLADETLGVLVSDAQTVTVWVDDHYRVGGYGFLHISTSDGGIPAEEPNDDIAGATLVESAQFPMAINGVLESIDDEDWFEFADDISTLQVDCGAEGREMHPTVHIYDGNGALIFRIIDGYNHILPMSPGEGMRIVVSGPEDVPASGPGAWWRCVLMA